MEAGLLQGIAMNFISLLYWLIYQILFIKIRQN